MGLMGDWLRGKQMKDPVRGSAHVVACSRPGRPAVSSNVVMNLIVSAEGVAPTAVEHECMCRQDRWPRHGMTLPVTLDRADPTRLKVEWDELPTDQDLIRQQTQALLAGGLPGAPAGQSVVVDLRGNDQVDRLERLAALHASGVLTDDEFAAAKARLLG